MLTTRITRRARYIVAALAAVAFAALSVPLAAQAQRAGSGSTPIVGSGIEIRPIIRGELVDATTRNDVQLTAGLTLRF